MASNQGFGLNYSSGFGGSGPYFTTSDNSAAQNAQQGYQQRLGQQQQNQFAAAQNQKQLAFGQQQLASETATKQQGYNTQLQGEQLASDTQKYQANLQQQRFNSLYGLLAGQLGGAGQGSYGYNGQGQVGTQPDISAAPVYSGQQIQQQVNSQRAGNDAATASAQRDVRQKMSGQGYGANSPLAMELGVGLQNQNLQSNTDSERQLRFDAANANSQQVLKGQTAQEQQFANRQQEDVARNQVYQSKYNAILAALSGLS